MADQHQTSIYDTWFFLVLRLFQAFLCVLIDYFWDFLVRGVRLEEMKSSSIRQSKSIKLIFQNQTQLLTMSSARSSSHCCRSNSNRFHSCCKKWRMPGIEYELLVLSDALFGCVLLEELDEVEFVFRTAFTSPLEFMPPDDSSTSSDRSILGFYLLSWHFCWNQWNKNISLKMLIFFKFSKFWVAQN